MNHLSATSATSATKERIVVYFHGAPGAPAESEIFHASAAKYGLNIVSHNRFAVDKNISAESYFQLLASNITMLAKDRQIDVIGFSIGAFAALQVCQLIPDKIKNLHLISPAAPLDCGDFINHMAGKSVFRLAKNYPSLFKILSYWQRLLAKYCPKLLVKMLFASAVAEDKVLIQSAHFQSWIGRVLQDCFSQNVTGYIREIRAYVSPWNVSFKDTTIKAHLWHGNQDNWSPFTMSEYLSQQFSGNLPIHRLIGLSHYSCLFKAVPEICEQLGKDY